MASRPGDQQFRVLFSADFRDEQRALVFPDIGLSLLNNIAGLSYEFLPQYFPEYVPDQLRDCDVIISLKPRFTVKSLDGIDRLCAIGRCGVGYDNVDLAACTEKDIAVFITPNAVIRPVAESIVLLLLAASHNLVVKDRLTRQGLWAESSRQLGREPRGRVVGTVGLGNIAKEAFRLLRPFGIGRFLAFDPYLSTENGQDLGVEMVSLDELLRLSDYVLINCPLTQQTRHLIGAREIGLMKWDSYLINTARGAIIDQSALIAALADNRIRGAALDVFETEPLAANSPLTRLDTVTLTSHSIAWTEELFRDMGREDCMGALAIQRGECPGNVVNKEVLSRPGFLRKLEAYKSSFQVS